MVSHSEEAYLLRLAGGAAMASIASGLMARGLAMPAFDDFTVTVRDHDARKLEAAVSNIDPDAVHPQLPDNVADALKFGLCLPERITRAILISRTSDGAAVATVCRRTRRRLRIGTNENVP